MLSLQEISDRFELQDLIYRYSEIIDAKTFDDLRTDVFTADAFIDYSAMGGSRGDLQHTIDFLKQALPMFPNSQHLNANIQLRLDGDEASGRVMCFNPMEQDKKGGGTHTYMMGLWYMDKYRRTDAGWRIYHRVEESSWFYDAPKPGMVEPPPV